MAITEHARHELHQALREILPMNCADTLMHHIPFDGWDQFARVETVDVARADTNSKIAELRTEVLTEIAELRTELKTEIAELRTELKTEIAELRTEVNTSIAELRTELNTGIAALRVEMHQGFAKNARWNTGFLITLIIGIIANTFR